MPVRHVSAYLLTAALVFAFAAAAFGSISRPPVALAAAGTALAVVVFAALRARRRRDPAPTAALALVAGTGLVAWAVSTGGDQPGAIRLGSLDAGGVTLLLATLLLGLLAWKTAPARLPPVIRAVTLAAILYALAGAVAHLRAGDGIDGALASNAPYPFDATWLRAGVIGCVVLLPLGLLGMVAAALVHLARRRVALAARLGALALAFAFGAQAAGIALSASALPTLVSFEGGRGAPGDGPAVEVRFPEDTAPAVAAEAARLGGDPRVLFTRVAVQIADEAYPGALRGAAGTLAAGAGNALDKALLLHDLLRSGDPSAELRFAECRLPPAPARAMAGELLTAHRVRRPLAIEKADLIAAQARGVAMQTVLLHWADAWRALVTIVRDQSAILASSLGPLTPAQQPDMPGRVAALLVHHVWVERRTGSGWTALDPTLGAAGFGRARCGADHTSVVPAADRFATATVRLTIEERGRGRGRNGMRSVLAAKVRIADLVGRNLAFLFAEPSGLEAARPAQPRTRTVSHSAAQTYTPLLRAGDRQIAGIPFEVTLPSNGAGRTAAAAASADAAASVLAGEEPRPSPAASPAPAEITGAWLRVSVESPDVPTETVSTMLFDRVGAAARRQGAPPVLGPLSLVDGEVVPLAAVWNIAIWSGSQAAGVGTPDGAAEPVGGGGAESVIAALGRVHSHFAGLRMALFEAVAGRAAGYFAAAPSVTFLATGSGFGQPADDGMLADVASDHLEILADGSSLPSGPARAAWSAASVVAERLVAGGAGALALGAAAPAATDGNDAVATFAAARAAGMAFSAIDSGHRQMLGGAAQTEDVRALLAADLDGGRTVIVPNQPPAGKEPAWFTVDPQTGALRDTMASGRHQAEYRAVTEAEQRTTPFWRRLGSRIACHVAAAGAILALAGGDASTAWKFAQVPATVAEEEEKWRKIGDAACEVAAGGAAGGPR